MNDLFIALGIYLVITAIIGYFLKLKKWQYFIAPSVIILLILSGSPVYLTRSIVIVVIIWSFLYWRNRKKTNS